MLNYLPCPPEVSNYALDQTKNEEKVFSDYSYIENFCVVFESKSSQGTDIYLFGVTAKGFVIWNSSWPFSCFGFQIGGRALWSVDIFKVVVVILYLFFC